MEAEPFDAVVIGSGQGGTLLSDCQSDETNNLFKALEE
jgi:hypothetical protein